jgi:Mn2+/Fe2+ NRAMP family transporter
MALLAANTTDIAADLAGMADAAEMLSGINAHWFVVVFALLISWATIRLPYHQIANVLKWLVLVLFAYPITAFVVGADWGRVARDTLVPSMPHTRDEWSMLVAILGTTISPYLFFWHKGREKHTLGRQAWSAEGSPSMICIRPASRAGMRIAVTANSLWHV